MALTPNSILVAFQASRYAGQHQLGGVLSDQLFLGIANGVSSWAVGQSSNLLLTGSAIGTLGAGTILTPSTAIIVTPKENLIVAALTGANVAGVLAASLGRVVALAIAQAFSNSAQYAGSSPTVGVGQDVSAITVVNPNTLFALLVANMGGAFAGTGPALSSLAQGLSNGICNMLLGGTGTGTVTGVASPTTGSGVTTSTVV